MLDFLNPIRGTDFLSLIIKLATAFLLGAAVGIERSYKNRPAGLRTHILIAIGSCAASAASLYLFYNANLPGDVSRISAAVVSGLGFLGAGCIIVTKQFTVKGLTTAAGLWTSGVMGLAIGAGFYEGAVLATVLILVTETCLGGLARLLRHDPMFCIQVLFRDKTVLDQVMRICKNHRQDVTNLQVVSDVEDDEPCYRALVTLRPRFRVDREKLFAEIERIEGNLSFSEVEYKDI